MHELPIIVDLLIIFGLALPVIYVRHRLFVPTLVGLLLTGIMIGPNALLVIEGEAEIETLTEIGIILLLVLKSLLFVQNTVSIFPVSACTSALLFLTIASIHEPHGGPTCDTPTPDTV